MRRVPVATILLALPLGIILVGAVLYPSLTLVWHGFAREGRLTLANLVTVLRVAVTRVRGGGNGSIC